MAFFLELKEKFFMMVGKREKLVLAAVKFVIALVAFVLIHSFVGYMDVLGNPLIWVVLAVVCAFVPIAMTLIISVVLILFNFYALALELCLMGLLLFVLMFFLYFRFTKDKGYYAILTPLFCFLRVPYVIPNAVGIMTKPYDVISVLCGTMVYFLLKNVRDNEALFRSFDEAVTGTSKITLAVQQLFVNREMFMYMLAFVVAALAVYFVRKSSYDHAWGVSLIVGSVAQFIIVAGGMISLGHVEKLLMVFIGSAIGLILSAGLIFMIRPLDYSRVERVEFEDEEYYYYVKAVPKASITIADKEVKQIASKKRKATRVTGRVKKNSSLYGRQELEQDVMTPMQVEEKTRSLSREDELARKAMEEFDVEGDWLE